MDISDHAIERFIERVEWVDNPTETIRGLYEQSSRLTQRQLLDRRVRVHPETEAQFWGVFYRKRFLILVIKTDGMPYIASVLTLRPKKVVHVEAETRHCPNCGGESRRANSKRYCRYCQAIPNS